MTHACIHHICFHASCQTEELFQKILFILVSIYFLFLHFDGGSFGGSGRIRAQHFSSFPPHFTYGVISHSHFYRHEGKILYHYLANDQNEFEALTVDSLLLYC